MGVTYTPEQLKKLGLVEKDGSGVYVPIKSLVAKKAEKIDPKKFVDSVRMGLYVADLLPSIGDIYRAVKKGENRKIKNATKSVENGISFDSNLEKYLYQLLTTANIEFAFQFEYVLQEKFRYGTEAIRAITLTVDFVLRSRNIICDTKGMQTQQGAMRYKMLKKHLYDSYNCFVQKLPLPEIVILKNKKECQEFVNRLLYQP